VRRAEERRDGNSSIAGDKIGQIGQKRKRRTAKRCGQLKIGSDV